MLTAVEQRDLAEHLARPHRGDFDRAIAGQAQRDGDAPVDDQQHRLGLVPLAPQDLARRQLATAQDPGELLQLRLGDAVEERNRGEEGDGLRRPVSLAVSPSNIEVERLEVEPAGSQRRP